MALLTAVVAIYFRRKDFNDSALGRRVLAGAERGLHWRAEAAVVTEVRWIGNFLGALGLLCLSAALLFRSATGSRAPAELVLSSSYFGFAWFSVYAALNPRRLLDFFRDVAVLLTVGPWLYLALDLAVPGVDSLTMYAGIFRPSIDLGGFYGVELAARISLLHAAIWLGALVAYAVLLAVVPAVLFAIFGLSKRACALVIGLSDERRKDTMVAAFLIVTAYGSWRLMVQQ